MLLVLPFSQGPSPQRTPKGLSVRGRATLQEEAVWSSPPEQGLRMELLEVKGIVCARGSVWDGPKCTKLSPMRKGLCTGLCRKMTQCQKTAALAT